MTNRASYDATHKWISHRYGKASKCEFNAEHVASRYEWANISGEYKRDITDYIQLCPSCHRKYDYGKNPYVRKKPLNDRCRKGHLFTPENTRNNKPGVRVCRTCRNEYMRNRNAQLKEAKNSGTA